MRFGPPSLSIAGAVTLTGRTAGPTYRTSAGVRYDPGFTGLRASERVTTIYEPLRPPPTGMANAQGERPGVLVVYGGGFTRAAPGVPLWVGRWLASRGYVVSVVEYRAVYSATVGTAPDDGVSAVDSMLDVCAAAAHLASRPGVDSNRIILIGHSTGGQVVSVISTAPAWLGTYGVSISQIAGVIGIDHASYSNQAFGGKPEFPRSTDSFSAETEKLWAVVRDGTPNASGQPTLQLGTRAGGDRFDKPERFVVGFDAGGGPGLGTPHPLSLSPHDHAATSAAVLPPQWLPYVGNEDGTPGGPSVGFRAGQALAWADLITGYPRIAAAGGFGMDPRNGLPSGFGVTLYPRDDYAQHDEMVTELGSTDTPEAAAYTAAALAAVDQFVGVTR